MSECDDYGERLATLETQIKEVDTLKDELKRAHEKIDRLLLIAERVKGWLAGAAVGGGALAAGLNQLLNLF